MRIKVLMDAYYKALHEITDRTYASDAQISKLKEIKDYVRELLKVIDEREYDPMWMPYGEALAELTYYNTRTNLERHGY